MADNNLQFNIGGDASDFLNAIKKVKKGLSSLTDSTEDVKKATSELGTKIFDLVAANPIFQELDKLTGGLAGNLVQMGKAAKTAFASIQIGSKLAKAALISTGVGAIVVALGLVAANWQKILTFVTGVNEEQRQITKSLSKQAEIQSNKVKLLNLQGNTLKLQGKTQKQINDLKIKELGLLLEIKKAQLKNFQDSLKQAQATQNANLELAKTVLNALNAPFEFLVSSIDFVLEKVINIASKLGPLGKGLTGPLIAAREVLKDAGNGVDKIINKIAETVVPDITSDLKKGFEETELAVKQTESAINKLLLANQKLKNSEGGGGKDSNANQGNGITEVFTPKYLANMQAGVSLSNQVSASIDNIGASLSQVSLNASADYQKLLAIGDELFKQFSEMTVDFAANTLGNVGESLGAALAQGVNVVNAVGSTLLASLGGFLSKIGDQFIKFGVAAGAFAKLKALIATGGPIATVLGASGLVAAGVALKAIGGAISATASGVGGGGSAGGGGASSSSGGGSYSDTRSYSGSTSQEQVVVFKISGQNLIGVLRNASEQNARIAGSNTLGFN